MASAGAESGESESAAPASSSASATVTHAPKECRLYKSKDDTSSRWPIVYAPIYNISFLGIVKLLHPFDSGKWGRVFQTLREEKMVSGVDDVISPVEINEDELLQVHTKEYLNRLGWSVNVARITEVPPVAILPNFIVRRVLLRPLRFQTGGTVLAGRLAMERGWSINIGGGFHHCSGESGGGFCAYADISLCAKAMQENFFAGDDNKKILVVDLDAHQGNGYANDVYQKRITDVEIFDMFNRYIYPGDHRAARAITRKVELEMYTADQEYLGLLRRHLDQMLSIEPKPRAIIYNAGTDVLENDPLGCLSISDVGIVERDEIVFQAAREKQIPIIMVTSGGYQPRTAGVIANSLLNLWRKGIIERNVIGS